MTAAVAPLRSAGSSEAGPALAALCRWIVDPVLTVVFPAACPVCRVAVARPTRGPLCEACWAALPRHRGALCGCGFPLASRTAERCGRCRRGRNPISTGVSLGPFEGSLRTLIHELKYRGRRRVAARLAELIVGLPEAAAVLHGPAVLVSVPLHPRRRRERGFNQAELLARAIGRRTGLTTPASPLARRRETPPQTGLSAARRRANVAGAFVVENRAAVRGRVVVIVDDVYTTGATLRACARALRAAGATETRVLTVARVA